MTAKYQEFQNRCEEAEKTTFSLYDKSKEP